MRIGNFKVRKNFIRSILWFDGVAYLSYQVCLYFALLRERNVDSLEFGILPYDEFKAIGSRRHVLQGTEGSGCQVMTLLRDFVLLK